MALPGQNNALSLSFSPSADETAAAEQAHGFAIEFFSILTPKSRGCKSGSTTIIQEAMNGNRSRGS
jgi:hypothetical protein